MNHPLAFAIVIAAATSGSGVSLAGELFDAPGPGYRRQIDLVTPAPPKVATPVLRIARPVLWSASAEGLPDPDSVRALESSRALQPFSEPIQLFQR